MSHDELKNVVPQRRIPNERIYETSIDFAAHTRLLRQ